MKVVRDGQAGLLNLHVSGHVRASASFEPHAVEVAKSGGRRGCATRTAILDTSSLENRAHSKHLATLEIWIASC